MIDIHSHILPCKGDDGSNSMDNTLSMVLSAQKQGITTMFATPHSEAFFREDCDVSLRFDIMRRSLRSVFPDMEFYLGSEVMLTASNMKEIVSALESGELPTMGGKYVLVEFYEEAEKPTVSFCLSKLVNSGFIPILAHWERYVNLRGQLEYIRNLHKNGCLVQLNMYSLEEYGDEDIRDWARTLIHEKLVDFLGTDSHKTWYRPPSVEQGMKYLTENCEAEYLNAITWKNANDLLIKKEGA